MARLGSRLRLGIIAAAISLAVLGFVASATASEFQVLNTFLSQKTNLIVGRDGALYGLSQGAVPGRDGDDFPYPDEIFRLAPPAAGQTKWSYTAILTLASDEFYGEEGPVELRGFKRIAAGTTDPNFAALHPVSGLGLGYNDYKAIEARAMVAAVAEGRLAAPDFRFGYRIQRIVDACIRSHEQRGWVRLDANI